MRRLLFTASLVLSSGCFHAPTGYQLYIPPEDARAAKLHPHTGPALLVPAEDAPRKSSFRVEPVQETWIEIERGSMRPPASRPVYPLAVPRTR